MVGDFRTNLADQRPELLAYLARLSDESSAL